MAYQSLLGVRQVSGSEELYRVLCAEDWSKVCPGGPILKGYLQAELLAARTLSITAALAINFDDVERGYVCYQLIPADIRRYIRGARKIQDELLLWAGADWHSEHYKRMLAGGE